MTAKAKVVNYTADQTASIVAAYVANPNKATVEKLAAETKRSTRSIIAKLSKEGVYVKAEYVGKTGEKPVKKDTVADDIGKLVGLNEADVSSLAKANKTALARILKALRDAVAEANAFDTETKTEANAFDTETKTEPETA